MSLCTRRVRVFLTGSVIWNLHTTSCIIYHTVRAFSSQPRFCVFILSPPDSLECFLGWRQVSSCLVFANLYFFVFVCLFACLPSRPSGPYSQPRSPVSLLLQMPTQLKQCTALLSLQLEGPGGCCPYPSTGGSYGSSMPFII